MVPWLLTPFHLKDSQKSVRFDEQLIREHETALSRAINVRVPREEHSQCSVIFHSAFVDYVSKWGNIGYKSIPDHLENVRLPMELQILPDHN
jgi:hypothetical protein